MAIYTKTGDSGKTALFGGKRVWKCDTRVEAYGAVDEATSHIGLAIESIPDREVKEALTQIQWDLYAIMAYLSGAELKRDDIEATIPPMEQMIDALDRELPKLTRFILPQGSEQAARIHIARAVVRTAERRIVAYREEKESVTPEDELLMKYINRLSDLLFMLARKYTPEEKKT